MAEILTGNQFVDELKGLQLIVGGYPSIDVRIQQVRLGIPRIEARPILGCKFMISTSLAFARSADMPPDHTIMFDKGLLLEGELEQFDYLDYPDVPIESIALGLEAPDIFTSDPDEAIALKRLSFRVPVLAIDTCVSLDLG